MALSIFFPSVSGMEAQSHALGTTATNIANIRTVGYKATDTQFYTLLGSTPVVKGNAASSAGGYTSASNRVDIDGVGYYDRVGITKQGIVSSTGNNYDVAVNNNANAFFVVKNPAGDTYYTRAGDFKTRTENGVAYLINNSGLYLQGFPANGDGTFANSLQNIKLDYADTVPSHPTTDVEITANVPADGVETSSYGITVYGPNNDGKAMNMIFTKVDDKVNTWNITFNIDDGTVVSNPIEAVFDGNGQLVSPKNVDISVNWNDGSSNPGISMDISKMTQYAGGSGIESLLQDGKPSGVFVEGYIDSDGIVKAKYTNGDTKDYAKLALASFTSPENLTPIAGTMFEANSGVGNISYVLNYDTENRNALVTESVEGSTSNIEGEFAKMVVIQRAYTLNSQSFTTANEMTEVAINLKT